MNLSSFCDALCAELSKIVPDGSSVSLRQVQKNNGVMFNAVCIQTSSAACAPVIYLDPLYKELQCGKTVEQIARSLLKEIRRDLSVPQDLPAKIRDFETAKDMLAFRLVSKARNENLLNSVPWRPFLDLAVIFYLRLDMYKNRAVSVCIRNELAEAWDRTAEELWTFAVQNTPRLLPPAVNRLEQLLPEYLADKAAVPGPVRELYVLSNEPGVYGASCLLYENVLDDLAKERNADLIILPSSIHEVLFLADSPELNYQSLRNTVYEVNREAVPPEDFLSDEVYRYDRSARALTIVSSVPTDEAGKDGKTNP